MASAAAGPGVAALVAVPGYGWVLAAGVAVAAALIDSYVVMPALAGKGRAAAKPPRLLDSPVGSNEPGAPRVFALGRRVRVPTHILWQATKVRESGGNTHKAGTGVTQQRVYFDALLSLNDRVTLRLRQLHGNGKLLIGGGNLVDITTPGMVVTVAGGRLVLTMLDTNEPDFTDKLALDDVCKLSGFVVTAGADPNVGYWKAAVVTKHTSTPSTIELAPYSGQVVAGIVATAGTAETPAAVTRVDDVAFTEGGVTFTQDPYNGAQYLNIPVATAGPDPGALFTPGEEVTVRGLTMPGFGSLDAVLWKCSNVVVFHGTMTLRPRTVTFPNPGAGIAVPGGSATNAAQINHSVPRPPFAAMVFTPGFVPENHYHNGADDQPEDQILADVKGTGTIPAYRGTAYQALDQFFAAQFGDQLPFSTEAVIEVDQSLTWAQAFRVLLERAGIPADAIDTWGIDDRPFEGFFVRGSVPAITQLQPLLIAGDILGQERDGTLALFNLPNADVVQVFNGPQFSDLGVYIDGAEDEGVKIVTQDTADEDLPTHIGVRHQDPDNGYADGYQAFGLRHPAGVDWQNSQEIDVSNLVLTRKQARDLAATSLRRAHVNRRTYRMVLGMRYLDLCENDLLTLTDDSGNEIVCRIIQRDIGSDLRVAVLCVAEDTDIAVHGSPVQTAAGAAPATVDTSTDLTVLAVDIPALRDLEWPVPAIKLAACANVGGVWAGCSLWVSFDGSTYTNRGTLQLQAGLGVLTTGLLVGPPAETYGTTAVTVDPTGAFLVDFANEGPHGVQDASLAEAKAGANWCAIIDADGAVEVLAFLTATFVSDDTWQLSGLLRGLRGTRPAAHADRSRFVLLSPFHQSGVEHIEFAGAITPQAFSIKVVPAGRTLDDVDPIAVTATWRNARPLPVRKVTKTIGASPFNARFTVTAPWSRAVWPLGAQPPHPLDDVPEGYRFTIYNPAGTTVLHTHDVVASTTTGSPALRDKWWDYTAAQQTADGYTPAATETFWVDVQQIGSAGLGPSILQEL